MTHVWFIVFISTFAGIGLGGIIAALINGFKRSIGAIYAVCTGLILGLISFEILPEVIQLGNWIIASLGFLAGVYLFRFIHLIVHKNSVIVTVSHKHHNKKLALFLAIVLSLHNLPMGIVLGTSEHSQFSIALLLALILHNIPEGMILFTPLFVSGFSFKMLFLLSFFVALPLAIGAFIGELIGMQNNLLWAFLISSTVGIIYMVTIKEILPESIRQSSNMYSVLISLITFCLLGVYLFFYVG